MIIYATADDLTNATPAWVSDVPANAGALLRWASIEVARAANQSLYGDIPTGNDGATLRDATCAQVASWVSLGVDPARSGTDFPAPVKKSSILGADVERDTSAQTQAVQDAANGLCDLARAILYSGGLLWMPTARGDEFAGDLPTYGLSGARLGVSTTWADSTDAWSFDVGRLGAPSVGSSAGSASPDQVIRVATADTTVAPGEEIWVQTTDAQTVTLTILHEPSGQHCRIKRVDNSTGTVLLVPVSGFIDGQSSFTLSGLSAVELDSDGTNLAVF